MANEKALIKLLSNEEEILLKTIKEASSLLQGVQKLNFSAWRRKGYSTVNLKSTVIENIEFMIKTKNKEKFKDYFDGARQKMIEFSPHIERIETITQEIESFLLGYRRHYVKEEVALTGREEEIISSAKRIRQIHKEVLAKFALFYTHEKQRSVFFPCERIVYSNFWGRSDLGTERGYIKYPHKLAVLMPVSISSLIHELNQIQEIVKKLIGLQIKIL